MLRDFLAGDRTPARFFGTTLLVAVLAACVAGCGIKGPLRLPPPPPPAVPAAPETSPAAPDTTPAAPSEPESATPRKP